MALTSPTRTSSTYVTTRDLTSVHPFVDGNSRTQRVFFDQLARDVGWAIE
ncbi:Fic family protein [Rhodococcus qingshengii]|nr:Fic family protein [Rhodococcus qingshengii]WCT05796.1 Fic family protein [Rhodococcus qingshengii]